MPYLHQERREEGIWFGSHRGRRLAAVAATVGGVVIPLAILFDDRLYHGGAGIGSALGIVGGGILPLALLGGLLLGGYGFLRRRVGATQRETIQTLCVALFVAFAVCTATGIWFRGEGMALVWAW